MRIARRLFVLCAMALTALAMSAGSATAQTPIEVNDGAGDPCSPCMFHAQSAAGAPSSLTLHVFGHEEVISSCQDEFEGEIWHEEGDVPLPEDPEHIGHITEYENDHEDNQACTRVNCNEVGENPGESEWPISHPEETGVGNANLGHLWVEFCLDEEANPDAAGRHCLIEVDVDEPNPHVYRFRANPNQDQCPITVGVRVEVSGSWFTEAAPSATHDDIEIVHDDDPQL